MAEHRFDPHIGRAVEEAEGIEVFEQVPSLGTDLREYEEAQGTASFVSPDSVVPPFALREGEPGNESLSGDEAEIEYVDDLDYDQTLTERYPDA